jgi:outer membrane protein assembly factor BamB
VDSAGNTLVTGALHSPTQRLRVEKLDPGGRLLWEYLEPSDASVSVGRSVDVDREGNAVVVGEVGGNWLMLALNPDGKLLWRFTYDGGGGTENPDVALSVRLTNTGDIIVAGAQHPVPASFPSLGAVEWRVARYAPPATKTAR